MKFITNWHKAGRTLVFTLLFTCSLLFYSIISTKEAAAQTFVIKSPFISNSTNLQLATLPPEGKFKEPENYAERSVQQLVQDTQSSFEQAVFNTNEVLVKLPEEIPQTTIEKEIENDEASLEKVSKSIGEIVEKVSNFRDKFVGTGVLVDKALISKLENLQASLEDSGEKVDILAKDTEQAKEGASSSLQNRIDKEIQILKEAFDKTDGAFKAFTLNPA